MATRGERFRSEQQKKGGAGAGKKRVSTKKPKKAAWSRNRVHAAVKATHALEEPTASGARPSRESTRRSANRAKPDAAFNATEQLRKGAPEQKARAARSRRSKVRGRG